jgi:hypothetical protein
MADILTRDQTLDELFDLCAAGPDATPVPTEEEISAQKVWSIFQIAILGRSGVISQNSPAGVIDAMLAISAAPFNAALLATLANPELALAVARYQALADGTTVATLLETYKDWITNIATRSAEFDKEHKA